MKEQYNKPSTESMQSLVGEIKQIIHDARAHAIRSVDFCRVHKTYPKGNALRSHKTNSSCYSERIKTRRTEQ